MLRFTKTPEGSIDLTHAHPSGLGPADGRPAHPALHPDPRPPAVRRRGQGIAQPALQDLRTRQRPRHRRGVFLRRHGRLDVRRRRQAAAVSAPVMLTAISLTVRPGEDDYELQLTEQAQINPALVRHLKISPRDRLRRQRGHADGVQHGPFDPQPVLDRLGTLVQPIHGAEVEHNLLVSTFADLSGNLDDPWINQNNPLVTALARSGSGERVEVPELEPGRFPSTDERDPADELLLLDADTDQQYVVDAVRAGDSLVVSSPPGTGQTQTAINTIGALVDEGKIRPGGGGQAGQPRRDLRAAGRPRPGFRALAADRQRQPAAAQGPAGPGDRPQREVAPAAAEQPARHADRAPPRPDGPCRLPAQRPGALGLLAVRGHAVAGRADLHPAGTGDDRPAQAQRAGQHPGPRGARRPAPPRRRARQLQPRVDHQPLARRAPAHPQGDAGSAERCPVRGRETAVAARPHGRRGGTRRDPARPDLRRVGRADRTARGRPRKPGQVHSRHL